MMITDTWNAKRKLNGSAVALPNLEEVLEVHASSRIISISQQESQFIFEFLRERQITRTLETGLAFGGSAITILAATAGEHHAIDPFQHQRYDSLGLKNIRKLGFANRLHFHEEFSHFALPTLVKAGLKIQFAFVDGGHLFDEIFIDYFFIDQMLEINGHILFHDAWMGSTQLIHDWIRTNRRDYKIVTTPIDSFLLVCKSNKDKRPWDHFNEMYPRHRSRDFIKRFFRRSYGR